MVFISIYFFDIIGKILIKKCENLCDIGGGIILLCKIRENLFCVKIIPPSADLYFSVRQAPAPPHGGFLFLLWKNSRKEGEDTDRKAAVYFALDHSFTLHFNI